MASKRNQLQEEVKLRILRLLNNNPKITTRKIAEIVGISNGSAYYVLTALVEKGLVKLENFNKNPRKGRYAYLLTPKGIREKSILTHAFIARKRRECSDLKNEIDALEREAGLISKLKSNTITKYN